MGYTEKWQTYKCKGNAGNNYNEEHEEHFTILYYVV